MTQLQATTSIPMHKNTFDGNNIGLVLSNDLTDRFKNNLESVWTLKFWIQICIDLVRQRAVPQEIPKTRVTVI